MLLGIRSLARQSLGVRSSPPVCKLAWAIACASVGGLCGTVLSHLSVAGMLSRIRPLTGRSPLYSPGMLRPIIGVGLRMSLATVETEASTGSVAQAVIGVWGEANTGEDLKDDTSEGAARGRQKALRNRSLHYHNMKAMIALRRYRYGTTRHIYCREGVIGCIDDSTITAECI